MPHPRRCWMCQKPASEGSSRCAECNRWNETYHAHRAGTGLGRRRTLTGYETPAHIESRIRFYQRQAAAGDDLFTGGAMAEQWQDEKVQMLAQNKRLADTLRYVLVKIQHWNPIGGEAVVQRIKEVLGEHDEGTSAHHE